MLIIHLGIAPTYIRKNGQKEFDSCLKAFYKEHFAHFSENSFHVCHVSKLDTLISIDLSSSYSMLFAHGVSELTDKFDGVFVESINYTC